MVAWLIAIHGEQATENWCRGVVSNFARPPQGNDRAQIEAVASGAAQYGRNLPVAVKTMDRAGWQ